MVYAKPLVSVTANAIEAIQSSTLKATPITLDNQQHVKPVAPATNAAYEADE